jgi:hypothetical protein
MQSDMPRGGAEAAKQTGTEGAPETGGHADAGDETPAPALGPLDLWLKPNWRLVQMPHWQRILGTPNRFQPGAWHPGADDAGALPEMPQWHVFVEVVAAFYGLPAVQKLVMLAYEESSRQLQRPADDPAATEANGGPVVAYATGQVLGDELVAIVSGDSNRRLVIDSIAGKEIPVPGVFGLSFKFAPGRAGSILPTGIRGTARMQAPDIATPTWEAGLHFNVTEFMGTCA